MSYYRDEVNKVNKEVGFTLRKGIKWLVIILILGTAIGWGVKACRIVGMDIDREVNQHSQQYVETKVVQLGKLYSDYMQLATEIEELKIEEGMESLVAAKKAQQKATVKRMHTAADFIPSSQVPEHIQTFLVIHRR